MTAALIFSQFFFDGNHPSLPFPPYFEYWALGFGIVILSAFVWVLYRIVLDLRDKMQYVGPSKPEKLALKEILSDPKNVDYAVISEPDARGNTRLSVQFIQCHPLARYGEIPLSDYRYSVEQILQQSGIKIVQS